MKKICRTMIVVLALAASARAEIDLGISPQDPFRLYSVAEGLSQKTVISIAQDHDGFIWVGTFGGLNRFDGQNFETFTIRQGLRNNLVQALFVDSKNRLWAGDAAGGLTLIEGGIVTRTIDPAGEGRGGLRSMVEVGDTLYIANLPGGLASLSLNDLDAGITPIPGAPNELIVLKARSDGNILMLGTDGLYLYRPGAPGSVELIQEDATALSLNAAGRHAVGHTDGRVGWLEGEDVQWLDTQYSAEINELIIVDGAIQWVVLDGLGIVPPGETNPGAAMLPGGSIGQSLVDDEGIFWVPTRAGLARYLGSRFRHYPLEYDDIQTEVFSMVPGENNDYWFGSSIGLLHLDQAGALINVSDQLGYERREVRDLKLSLDKKTLWIGQTYDAMYAIDIEAMQTKKVIGDETTLTMGLARDRLDKIWSGSYVGKLSVYDPATDTSRTFEIASGASIYALALAEDDYLWFGANYQGLFRINTNDPDAQPELMVSEAELGHDFYTHMVVEGGGADTTVWLVTTQGGVFRYAGGEAKQVIMEPSFADNTVYSVQPLADNTLVLATSRGVYRYDIATDALEQYMALDGFVAIEAKAHATYYDGGDTLMIGTTSGVTLMDVSIPMAGVSTPKPLITHRSIDEIDIDSTGALPKNAKFSKVVIEFTAVSTRKPTGLEFSYRLVGQETAWSSPTGTNSIGYSNLNPGQYTFELRARLPGGSWSMPTQWTFTVPTPFWRTYWFIALMIAAALLLTWAIIQWRLMAIARVNQRLRSQVAERTRSIEAARRELEQTNEKLSGEIVERQKADALRQEVEIRFQQAFEHSPIGMALVDSDGLVYEANPKMKGVFWPDSAKEDRAPLIHVIAESDQQEFSAFLAACAEEGTDGGSFEANCVASNGDALRIDFRPAAIRDSNGQLKYIVLSAHDVTESRAMTDQLEYQARFDELTGLVNRRAFSQSLEKIGAKAKAGLEAFLMFLDLDQFKVVNDTSGHAAGDELLRTVARLLKEGVREGDIVARLGGDEFALVVVGCDQAVAMRRAEHVRQRIQDLEFLWNGEVFRIGVSIGVVPIKQSIRDLGELQQIADAACYAAKEAGRNRVHLVSGEEDTVHEQRGEMRWVQRLNDAIDNDGFALFGQRIQPLTPGAQDVERIEVLLRMRDKQANRLIPPGAFLPAAERYGVQGRLDLWMVRRVIETLRGLDPAEMVDQQFWVNLSAASIGDPKTFHELTRMIEKARLPAGSVNFEASETAVSRKINDATTLVQALQDLGCGFALDDFGSGLSSFGYLRQLNVDYLKIGGQFVRNVIQDSTDRIFVKSIIDIAHTLEIQVVTDLVEDDEIIQMVRSLGADYAQGFGIHRPEPLGQLLPTNAFMRLAGVNR